MKRSHSGFTLIELLIVVAIIAILAAIAVPNFLEAQTRAKVSRAKSDLRTLVTGIEAYIVDNNAPPREYLATIDGPFFGQTNASGIMSNLLSTPIAYLTNAYMLDPFVREGDNIPPDEKYFSYANVFERLRNAELNRTGRPMFSFATQLPGSGNIGRGQVAQANFGNYYILSVGPDRSYFNNRPGVGREGVVGREYIQYDPTNGTVSFGNILRTQKFGFDAQPRTPDVIGAH